MAGPPKYRVKGAMIRSYVKYLEREKLLGRVIEQLSPEYAALLKDPPLVGTWVDAWALVETGRAALALVGPEGFKRMALETVDAHSRYDFIRPFLLGVMRLFGMSPATLFSRLDDLSRTSVEGMEFRYTAKTPQSGVVQVRYLVDKPIPAFCWISTAAVFENIFVICKIPGKVGECRVGRQNTGEYDVSW